MLVLLFSAFILLNCREVAIDFSSDEKYEEFIRNSCEKHCLVHNHQVIDNIHRFTFDDSAGKKRNVQFDEVIESLQNAVQSSEISWFEEQIPKKREKRVRISDPDYAKQWHLHGDTGHLNVVPVWDQGIFGQGVRIAIVDDGIQSTHPDLSDNVKMESSWNFNGNKQSCDPTYMKGHGGVCDIKDWHGTASAGAAAARNDGHFCGVGVAPHAELAGIAILQNNAEVGDAIEASALSYMPDKNHIYSNSWGPMRPGSGHMNEKPGPIAWKAIEKVIKTGRNGLGGIYVWAAGNDGRTHDNCNYDGYASMRYAILIGASTENGNVSDYSEPCSAMLAVAPGGRGNFKIHTSDLLFSDGLTPNNCTPFSGTSAACPLGAGVVALILSVNPNLTWLEVQFVIVEGSTPNFGYNVKWVKNAAGYYHNNHFGFGLLNVKKLIEVAQSWLREKRQIEEIYVESENKNSVKIDNQKGESIIEIDTDIPVHHVISEVWTSHKNVATTTIILRSPSGTESMLADPHNDQLSKWNGWEFLSRAFHGESSKGKWTLIVTDSDFAEHSIEKWKIKIWGHNKNYTFSSGPRTSIPNQGSKSQSEKNMSPLLLKDNQIHEKEILIPSYHIHLPSNPIKPETLLPPPPPTTPVIIPHTIPSFPPSLTHNQYNPQDTSPSPPAVIHSLDNLYYAPIFIFTLFSIFVVIYLYLRVRKLYTLSK